MLIDPAPAPGMTRSPPRSAVPGGGRYRGDFASFADLDALVLAVSGGPDSMALLLLAADWARHLEGGAPAIYVATVDHGLRPGSAGEAAQVAILAAEHGFPHATLAWRGEKPTARIQERARAARYELLADHARAVGARHVATAHHADDQAETILLRLGRGSGVAGLAGMRDVTDLAPDVRLARPLLGRTKAELVAICRAMDRPFVEDPANADPRFARARLRATSRDLARIGLDRDGLTRLGRRMARADAALEAEAARMERSIGASDNSGTYAVMLLATAAPEIRLRTLGRLIARVNPEGLVRLERLENLAERLFAALDSGTPCAATLAGVCLSLGRDGTLTIRREGPRRRGRRDG